jgi:hypothetical protein
MDHPSEDEVLVFTPEGLGIQKGTIRLTRLYADPRDRERFEDRWPRFLSSEAMLAQVVWRLEADQVCFLTESLLPTATDSRRPVLLIVGNPAPHSVLSGLPFSFEASHRQHRFWVALAAAGLLTFDESRVGGRSWSERNRERKDALYALRYDSPFRLGIAVYFSMPSPAAAAPWAGVAGLRRLFGTKALDMIARAEEERLAQAIRDFNGGAGAVIALQRDAYEGLRRHGDPAYSARSLRQNVMLEARCKFDPRIPLICGPPTRLIHSVAARTTLAQIKSRLMEEP